MISVPIRDTSGGESGSYEFDPAELVKGDVNRQLLHDAVVMYQAIHITLNELSGIKLIQT